MADAVLKFQDPHRGHFIELIVFLRVLTPSTAKALPAMVSKKPPGYVSPDVRIEGIRDSFSEILNVDFQWKKRKESITLHCKRQTSL